MNRKANHILIWFAVAGKSYASKWEKGSNDRLNRTTFHLVIRINRKKQNKKWREKKTENERKKRTIKKKNWDTKKNEPKQYYWELSTVPIDDKKVSAQNSKQPIILNWNNHDKSIAIFDENEKKKKWNQNGNAGISTEIFHKSINLI